MKKVSIGFSKPKNKFFPILSYLIRLCLGTRYSHVYLKFYSESLDRHLVYEAVGQGVRFVGLNLWEQSAEEVKEFKIDVSEEEHRNILTFCVDNAGKEYGFMQNLGVLIAKTFKLSKNPFKKGLNCSEVIAQLLFNHGYPFDKEFDLITPKDIYLALDK